MAAKVKSCQAGWLRREAGASAKLGTAGVATQKQVWQLSVQPSWLDSLGFFSARVSAPQQEGDGLLLFSAKQQQEQAETQPSSDEEASTTCPTGNRSRASAISKVAPGRWNRPFISLLESVERRKIQLFYESW